MSQDITLENAVTAIIVMEHYQNMGECNLAEYQSEHGIFELRRSIVKDIAPKIDAAFDKFRGNNAWWGSAAYDFEIVPHILDTLDDEGLQSIPQSRYDEVMHAYLTKLNNEVK
ncbi:MAG: hypothetical protein RPR28_06360 [Cycloclasticus sp.]